MYSGVPPWLNTGDNAWQITAATLVGLMSVPGLVVLYGGVMQKRWAINSMMLTFGTFSIVLIVWVLWAFKMGFGHPIGHGLGFFSTFVGKPGNVLTQSQEQGQANIPLISGAFPTFRFPESTLCYFQFVFAAITPILALGSVLGRVNIKAWLFFSGLWITFVYAVDAFLLWGGGWFAHKGALDFSGGYVIHLSAGVTGFVATWVIGPRLFTVREIDAPNGVLWSRGHRSTVAGLERLQRRGPIFRGYGDGRGRGQHKPVYCCRVPDLGPVGLHHREQAVADRRRQRHDHWPGGDHPGGRVRERVRRDCARRDRVDDRVLLDQVPQPRVAVPGRG